MANWTNQQTTAASDLDRFNLNSLYRSLNRAVLYHLSRPILTRSDQQQMIGLFSRLDNPSVIPVKADCNLSNYPLAADLSLPDGNRSGSLIFSDANEDPEFPACLVHLLMQLVRADRYGLCSGVIPRPKSFLLQTGSSVDKPQPQPESNDSDICEAEKSLLQESHTSQSCSYYHTTFDMDDELDTDNEDDVPDRHGTSEEPSKSVSRNSSRGRRRGPPDRSPSSHSPRVRPSSHGRTPDSVDLTTLTPDHVEAIVQGSLKLWAECYRAKKSVRVFR